MRKLYPFPDSSDVLSGKQLHCAQYGAVFPFRSVRFVAVNRNAPHRTPHRIFEQYQKTAPNQTVGHTEPDRRGSRHLKTAPNRTVDFTTCENRTELHRRLYDL